MALLNLAGETIIGFSRGQLVDRVSEVEWWGYFPISSICLYTPPPPPPACAASKGAAEVVW